MWTFQKYSNILISVFVCENDVKCWVSWYISLSFQAVGSFNGQISAHRAHNNNYNYRVIRMCSYTDEAQGSFISRARFPEITRCSRRVHAPARRRQTVENLITSNNKNGYLDAALSQEDHGNGDNGRANAASKLRLLFASHTPRGRTKAGCWIGGRYAGFVVSIFDINNIITALSSLR